MKYLILLFIGINLSFGQIKEGSLSGTLKLETDDFRNLSKSANKNINYNGNRGGFSNAIIVKIAENEYWVKNVEINSKSGDVYSFNDVLMKNHLPLIKQVTAFYGYVLSFSPNSDVVEVYIADETGSKNSDAIFILLK